MNSTCIGASFRRAALLLSLAAAISIWGCSSGGGGTTTPQIAVQVTPSNPNVKTGQTQQFAANVTGTTNTAVTWQVSSAAGGNIGSVSTSGLYTPPAAPPSGSVTVTATSVADTTKSNGVTFTVADGTAPSTPTGLSANATSATQIALAWTAASDNVAVTGYQVQRCSGNGCSPSTQVGTPATNSFNDSGLAASTSYTYRVSAVDAAGNVSSFSTTAIATTQSSSSSGISVSVTPVRGGLTVTQKLSLTPTVTGDALNQGVSWSFSSTGSTTGGSFSSPTSASGTPVTFTAPSGAGVVTITASSVSDLTKTASATIGVTDLPGVFTYHNDNARDGVNSKEYALTTANVNPATFGKLFSCNMDGAVYAQPLWVANFTINGGKHNVIFAVSMRDTAYLFDADASPCVQYWSKSMLPTGETYVSWNDVQTADIFPDIGILGTPVIDPSTNAVYLVAKSKTTSGTTVFHQRLHALNLVDGSERTNSPVDLTGSITYPGSADVGDAFCPNTTGVPFCPLFLNQRSGLALDNGVVYAAWASHGDNQPYHGWVLGFSTSNLAKTGAFNSTPNSGLGGIWMAGGAPAIDASHNLYAITGNGNWDGNTEFGDSLIKLNPSVLTLNDYFTPHGQDQLSQQDLDFGSGGAVVLADTSSPTHPHLIIGGGKGSSFNGELYILNRDTLGHNVAGDTQIVQLIVVGGGLFSTEAYWNNTIYVSGTGTPIKAYTLNTATGLFDTSHVPQTPSGFNFPGATPSISATGTTNGIVWALDTSNCGTRNNNCSGSGGPAILHAYDASNVATELWNSSMNAADTAGVAVKFVVPTVANGKVYVSTRGDDTTAVPATVLGRIDVYGLKPN